MRYYAFHLKRKVGAREMMPVGENVQGEMDPCSKNVTHKRSHVNIAKVLFQISVVDQGLWGLSKNPFTTSFVSPFVYSFDCI